MANDEQQDETTIDPDKTDELEGQPPEAVQADEVGEADEPYGIADTLDVIEALGGLAGIATDAATGNVIAVAEGVATEADEVVEAVRGADDIPEEVGDLSDDELQELGQAILDEIQKAL